MVGSVDRALRLIQMLRDHGQLRLKAAAEELDVAESTVHRLMATLVFHGFAIQDDSRAYLPGMALGVGPAGLAWTRELRDIAIPHIEQLSARTGETVNLVVLVGTRIHFLWSQEGNKALRIVSRSGAVMPARLSAGGRALLAELPEEHLRHLYQGPTAQSHGENVAESEFVLFLRELRLHRRNGFATANQEIEDGVAAMAMPVRNPSGAAVAAFSVSAPAVRSADLFSRVTMHLARATREAIESDIVGRVPAPAPSAQVVDPVPVLLT
ncbi:MAG: putative transcriptional regulator, IclR family [Modestobacter sp.]|nr:putative transcriptional regulator, IclR family [Modestobacter sp.]